MASKSIQDGRVKKGTSSSLKDKSYDPYAENKEVIKKSIMAENIVDLEKISLSDKNETENTEIRIDQSEIKDEKDINRPSIINLRHCKVASCQDNAATSSGYESENQGSPYSKVSQQDEISLLNAASNARDEEINVFDGNSLKKKEKDSAIPKNQRSFKKKKHDYALPWEIYTKRFSYAKKNMETKLAEFIHQYSPSKIENKQLHPVERFAVTQIIELAQSLYRKSLDIDQKISSKFFSELLTTLETLQKEAEEKSPSHLVLVPEIIHKLCILMARPARLLECLELKPTKFYNLVEQERTLAEFRTRNFNLTEYIKDRITSNHNKDYENSIIEVEPKTSFSARHCNLKIVQKDIIDFDSPQNESGDETVTSSISSSCETENSLLPSGHDFEEIKLISQGAYGSVYLVRHVITNDKYALKKINKSHALLKNQVNQIFAERDILSFTENPFVVSMYCSFETQKNFCMVMEYVEGGDCASLLKNIGIFPVEMARMYSAELLLAVEYIHNYGIIHRDIKPDNILITAYGHIKLTDFGLSKVGMMNMTTHLIEDYICEFRDNQVLGTPDYIAPEVILNKPYGRGVDYWSIGVVLYEFLVGCTPFYGDTPEELFHHIVTGTIEWPEDDEAPPDDAQNLVCRLLERDSSSRIGSLGASEVKEHIFFESIEWSELIRQKSEFVPDLKTDCDTSYFDTRTDRYFHHIDADRSEDSAASLPTSFCFTSSTKRFQNTIDRADNQSCSLSRQTSGIKQSSSTSMPSSVTTTTTDSITKDELEKGIEIEPEKISKKPVFENVEEITDFKQSNLPCNEEINFNKKVYFGLLRRSDSLSAVRNMLYSESENQNISNVKSSLGPYNLRQTLKSASVDARPQNTVLLKKSIKDKSFGFTLKAIRVRSKSDHTFIVYHMIDSIIPSSPAERSDIRTGDIVTHINQKPIDGLTHVQVVRLLYKDPKEALICVSSFSELGISVKNISSDENKIEIPSYFVPIWRKSSESTDSISTLRSLPAASSPIKKTTLKEKKKKSALKKIKDFFTKPSRSRKKHETIHSSDASVNERNYASHSSFSLKNSKSKRAKLGTLPVSPLVMENDLQKLSDISGSRITQNVDRSQSAESDGCASDLRTKRPYEYRLLAQTFSSILDDRNSRTSLLEIRHKVGDDVSRKIQSLENSINKNPDTENN